MGKGVLEQMKRIIIGALLFLGVVFFNQSTEASDENGEIFCLAQNIYFESGNQPLAGQVAVSQVVLNRVESDMFPNTICEVITQAKTFINWKGNELPIRNQCQFSWYCDGKSDEPVDSKTWIQSILVARRVVQGEWSDITEGALWYHADYVYPDWASSLNETVVINNHLFYK